MLLTCLDRHTIAQPLNFQFRISNRDKASFKVNCLVFSNSYVPHWLGEHWSLSHSLLLHSLSLVAWWIFQVTDTIQCTLMLWLKVDWFLGWMKHTAHKYKLLIFSFFEEYQKKQILHNFASPRSSFFLIFQSCRTEMVWLLCHHIYLFDFPE